MPSRALIHLVLQLLLAVALGVASAWLWLRDSAGFGGGPGVSAGPWRTSLLAGATDADLYTRARVALGGLLALRREETMYYVAQTDSEGRALRSRCRYRVSGVPPAARWWSVTAYADDFFLFADAGRRYSVNGSTAQLDAQGRFGFVSGPLATAADSATPLPWLPTPGDRGLLFTLRIYNPAPSLAAAPATLQPPRIERLGDCP